MVKRIARASSSTNILDPEPDPIVASKSVDWPKPAGIHPPPTLSLMAASISIIISTAVTIRKRILYVPIAHCPWPSLASTEPPGPGEHALHQAGGARAVLARQARCSIAFVPLASPTLFSLLRCTIRCVFWDRRARRTVTLVCTAVALSVCTQVPPHFKPLACCHRWPGPKRIARTTNAHGEHQLSIMAVARARGCRGRGRRGHDGRAQCCAASRAMAGRSMAVGRHPTRNSYREPAARSVPTPRAAQSRSPI